MKTIEEVRALREARRHDEHRQAAFALVTRAPNDPRAQLEAALALDHEDQEYLAIKCYDAAFKLGVPEELQRQFLVRYSVALRKVGRAEEAVALLAQAVADDPDYAAYTAFLALALAEAGHPRAALATMLGAALDASRPGAFDRFEPALIEAQRRLLDAPDGLMRGA